MSNRPILDQVAHATAAAVLLLPVLLWPNPLTGAWAGFCAGMIREVTEEAPLVTLGTLRAALNSRLDLTVWTLTGAIIGAII